MGTLQDELRKAGLVKEKEIEPRQEFITGEIQYTRSNGIVEIGKSLYGKPVKESLFKFKPRHGRTRIMNIKEQMDKRKIKRDSFQFIVVQYLLDSATEWMSAIQVSEDVKWNRPSTSSLLTNLRKTGFLYFEGRQGEKGWVYKLKEQYHKCSPEEICLDYLDRMKHIRKEDRRHTERKKADSEIAAKGEQVKRIAAVMHGKAGEILEKGFRDAIKQSSGLPETINIVVSGNINITFKLG